MVEWPFVVFGPGDEAIAGAHIQHPNVASASDFGKFDGESCFLVLEYVEGTPITEWCDAHRADLRQRLELFVEVADAVRAAHANLVIHLDLGEEFSQVTLHRGGDDARDRGRRHGRRQVWPDRPQDRLDPRVDRHPGETVVVQITEGTEGDRFWRGDAVEVITAKRDGHALSDSQIDWVIDAYTRGDVADEQMSALTMAILLNGMTRAEISRWTAAMIASGERMDFSALSRPTSDKHSTGGVGDKITLPLAPLVAACGAAVPQLSGRGLGHTGGTLDKLESIPGWRAALSNDEMTADCVETLRNLVCSTMP